MNLKPCPFCGSQNVELNTGYVYCWDCNSEGPFIRKIDEGGESLSDTTRALLALDKWNSRALSGNTKTADELAVFKARIREAEEIEVAE